MALGKLVQIGMGVRDLTASLAYYEALGFQLIGRSDEPYLWAQLSDGQHLLLLNQDGAQYRGLMYFTDNAETHVTELAAAGIEPAQRRDAGDRLGMAIFVDPDGHPIGLVNHDPAEMHRPGGEPFTRLGKFGEFATAVADRAAAAAFYEKLGFQPLHVAEEPYPWGIWSDGLIMLGLHQTPDFSGAVPTYFSTDSAQRITALQADGFRLTAMFDEPDTGATLIGPDDEPLFIFHGDV